VNRRAFSEGLALCVFIITTPLVILWGSASARTQLGKYWDFVALYFGIAAAMWAFIGLCRLVGWCIQKIGTQRTEIKQGTKD
jgi:amino acid transporter